MLRALAALKGSHFTVSLILASILLSPAVQPVLQGRLTNATVSSTPDFMIRVTPDSITVPHNPGLSVSITVTSVNNFAGTVTLASTASLPTGPGPASVTVNSNGAATSILFYDTFFVPPGDYLVNITGTSGTLQHWTTLNINLVGPDFQISSTQTTVTEVPEGFVENASRITVTGIDNFSGPVRFFAYSTGPFIQTEFSPGTVKLPTNGTASSQLTILGSRPVAQPGIYSLVVGASNDGSLVSLTHTTTIQVRVQHTIGPTVTISSVSISQAATQATVTVNFSTTDPDGRVDSLNVYWGDDTGSFHLPGTTAFQSHVYNSLGTFTITITARDSAGAISPPATRTFNLNAPSSSAGLGLITLALAPPVLYLTIGTTIALIAAIAILTRRKPTRQT